MKSLLNYFVVVFLIIFFSSCSVAPKIIFFNNTDFQVEIFNNKTRLVVIEPKHNKELYYPITQTINIKTQTTNWVYSINNYPPIEYYKPNGRSEKMRFQLEATGEIYVLLPTEIFPAKDFNNQPIGFPIKP